MPNPVAFDTSGLSSGDIRKMQTFLERYDAPHLLLAAHAAFPVVLTPDLLYKIWQNFRKDERGAGMRIPAVAVSDVLMSPLCRSTGRSLFEIPADIRTALLRFLRSEERFGPVRLRRLAFFLKFYLRENPQAVPSPAFFKAQEFTYLAQLDPETAARQLLRSWEWGDTQQLKRQMAWSEPHTALEQQQTEAQLGTDPLQVAVEFLRGVQSFREGDEPASRRIMQRLKEQGLLKTAEGDAAGIRTRIPASVKAALDMEEKEGEDTEQRHFAKVHLLTDSSLDQTAMARQLFNVNDIETGPLKCYQYNIEDRELNNVLFGATFNIWQWSNEAPLVLDRFMVTRGGYYYIAVPSGPVEEIVANAHDLINRIHTQIGSQDEIAILVVALEKGATATVDTDLILSRFEKVKTVSKVEAEVSIEDIFYQRLEQGAGSMPVRKLNPTDNLTRELMNKPFQQIPSEKLPESWEILGNQLDELEKVGLLRYFKELSKPSLSRKTFTEPTLSIDTAATVINQAKERNGVLSKEVYNRLKNEEVVFSLLKSLGVCWEDQEGNLSFYPFLSPDDKDDLAEKATIRLKYQFEFLPEDFWLRLIGALREGIYSGGKKIWSLYEVFSNPEAESNFKINKYFDANLLEVIISDSIQESYSGQATAEVEETADLIQHTYPYPLSFRKQVLHIPAHATPDMVRVEGGTFTMGWKNEERDGKGYDEEKPAHEVKLDSFSISKYQVTFEEYDAFCEATGRKKPRDEGWGRGRRPVINVDWYDAIEYCNWLSELWGLDKVYEINKDKKDPKNKSDYDDKKWLVRRKENANGYRLPTEAEWEYAARGGQERKGYLYAGSNDLDEVGWYRDNAGSKTHPVGEKKPNELGLYDMSGNVYEWCWDWYDGEYYQQFSNEPAENPYGPEYGTGRVLRGGAWYIIYVQSFRVSYRSRYLPSYRDFSIGFRLAQD